LAPTRNRMIDAAIDGLRRRGVAGMSFTEILAASGAARGAIYHHFPGGKTQLVAEAASANAEDVALPGDTPLELVRSFLEMVRPVVEASASGSGCAVAAVTLGGDAGDQRLRDVARAAFGSWTHALAERLIGAGMTRNDAPELATTLLMLLEGAHVLTRADGSIEPFDRAAHATLDLVRSRYDNQRRPRAPRRA
jgi:TetR/AcrR family transcriptional repressor of lmrAB and yxaGH operons